MVLAAGAFAASAAPSYTLVDLASLSQGHATVVRAPNARGEAGGGGRLNGSRGSGRRGLLFENGVTAQVAGLNRDDDSTVFSVNDNGAFVGSANTATAVRAFASSRRGVARELPPLAGDSASVAYGINNQDEAVGFSSGAGGQRAVIWAANGTPTALPAVAGAVSSRATDISIRGDVAGVATVAAGQRPVLWQRGQPARSLPLIPGDSTGEAYAVNGRGEVVGYTANPSGTVRHAALWTVAGEVVSLGALPGGEFSEAFGSNNAGAVVGGAIASGGGRAFLWTRAGGMQDLNTLIAPSRVVLTKAVGINNAGAIVVVGHEAPALHAGGAGHDHEEVHDLPVRVFLLRPVGAP